MAFVLVKWLKEDRVSTIPSAWVIQPKQLPDKKKLPVEGKCMWRKKSSIFDTILLDISG